MQTDRWQASTQRNPDNRERRLRGSGAPLPWGLDVPAKATGTPSMARNDCMNERKKIPPDWRRGYSSRSYSIPLCNLFGSLRFWLWKRRNLKRLRLSRERVKGSAAADLYLGRTTTTRHVHKRAVRQDNFSAVDLYPEIAAASPGRVHG
jgi:hypothetical protein